MLNVIHLQTPRQAGSLISANKILLMSCNNLTDNKSLLGAQLAPCKGCSKDRFMALTFSEAVIEVWLLCQDTSERRFSLRLRNAP